MSSQACRSSRRDHAPVGGRTDDRGVGGLDGVELLRHATVPAERWIILKADGHALSGQRGRRGDQHAGNDSDENADQDVHEQDPLGSWTAQP